MRTAILWLVSLVLVGCGGSAGFDPAPEQAESLGGLTLAASPAAPPLAYEGPVEVRFASYAAEVLRSIHVGPLGLTVSQASKPGGPGSLGVLPATGVYVVVVELEGRAPLVASLYLGAPIVTISLFP